MPTVEENYALSKLALGEALKKLPEATEDSPAIINISVFAPARTVMRAGSVTDVQMFTLTFRLEQFRVDKQMWFDWVLDRKG